MAKKPKPGERKMSPRRVRATLRQAEAVKARVEGAPWDVVAERAGYAGKGAAFNAVASALRKSLREPCETFRELELRRLDTLWLIVFPLALEGDGPAFDRCLAISARRAALAGLNAPTKTEVAGVGGAPLRIEHKLTDVELAHRIGSILSGAGDAVPLNGGAQIRD